MRLVVARNVVLSIVQGVLLGFSKKREEERKEKRNDDPCKNRKAISADK